jgi:hypothetical protein
MGKNIWEKIFSPAELQKFLSSEVQQLTKGAQMLFKF